MPILSLGVLDVAYSTTPPGPFKTKQGPQQATTTGKVAQILEDNYDVMSSFYSLNEEKIAGLLAKAMADAFRDKVNGRTVGTNPMFDAEQQIQGLFRRFILGNEINKPSMALTSTPVSVAAAKGVNPRKKHPYAKANRARPAFVATGLYLQSFRAWFKP